MRALARSSITLFFLLGCEATREPSPPGSGADASVPVDDAGSHDAGVTATTEGIEALERLAGLWAGPVTSTPLGDFSRMIMDLRPADARVLFGRVDLDEANALRFALFVETHGGRDVLVFRNGGLFLGLTRDTRTILVEAADMRWRFCALQGGCSYVDATFTLTAPDRLTLFVDVRGQPHVRWSATLQAPRAVPATFPETPSSLGTGDAPFPPMPELEVTVRWATPLAADAEVWVLLSTRDCDLAAGTCEVSRHMKAAAAIGATEARLRFSQVHAGEYRMLAFVDRNQNFARTLSPDRGDGVAIPNQPVTVVAEGTSTAQASIVYDLP